MPKTSKCTNISPIYATFLNFARDFVNQNVEVDQQRMILLSNRVVCGDKCSFVKKKLQQGPRNSQQILLFFYIFVFSWIKILKRFNNN